MTTWNPDTEAELRALARAATPGPWYAVAGRLFGPPDPSWPMRGATWIAEVPYGADQAYAGAWSPTVALAALDEIARLRDELEVARRYEIAAAELRVEVNELREGIRDGLGYSTYGSVRQRLQLALMASIRRIPDEEAL